jgi:hypothetical protein
MASNGAVYTKVAGTTGAASADMGKFLTDPAALTKHLKEQFPQGCLSIASPPCLRASEYKKIGKTMQSTLSFAPATFTLPFAPATIWQPAAPVKPAWNMTTAALAAREFECPKGATIIHRWPDMFDPDFLSRETSFQIPYKDKEGRSKVSVLTPCPSCNSNWYLTIDSGWSCQKGSVRRVLDVGVLYSSTGWNTSAQIKYVEAAKKARSSLLTALKCGEIILQK